MTSTRTAHIVLRSASSADERALRDLSALDSAPTAVRRPALLAVVDDEPVAALSLADGRVVADPFRPTADVVEMLRLRSAA